MILSGGSRANWRFFADHLTNARDNEKVLVLDLPHGPGTIYDTLREWDVIASGTDTTNFFYHVDLNPREGEELTPEQAREAFAIAKKNLGMEDQPSALVAHVKDGRWHLHGLVLRIDLETGKSISDSLTYRKHEAAAREIEKRFDLEPVESVLVKDRETPRPERRAKNKDYMRGAKVGLSPDDDVTRAAMKVWEKDGDGAAFKAALAEEGLTLCNGRRGFCVVDPAGNEHSLARRLPNVKAAEVRERLKDIDPDSLPTVEEAKKAADAWGPKAGSDAAEKVRRKRMRERHKPEIRRLKEKREHRPNHDAARLLENLTREVSILKDDAAAGKLTPKTWKEYKAARDAEKQAVQAKEGFAAREAARKKEGRGLQGPGRER